MDDIIELSSDFDKNINSSSFGGGIELLINEKNMQNNNDSNLSIKEIDNLEMELNQLVDDKHNENNNLYGVKSSFLDEKPSVHFNSDENAFQDKRDYSMTEETNRLNNLNTQTWDGYARYTDIPTNGETSYNEPKLTKEELLREKLKYLRKLENLEKKGVELSKKYTIESSLLEMQGEYEMIHEEKSKQNSIKFQANLMMTLINGIEFLNSRFDPFDIKLDGWGEQVNENINDYDEIFGELYDKYKSKTSISPEIKLMFQLGGSAMMIHMTNTIFKSSMPNMDDILRQNPDLMSQFQNAAINSMSNSNPGFAGFMNNIVNNSSSNYKTTTDGGYTPFTFNNETPSPPISQNELHYMDTPIHRGGNNTSSRPDLRMAMMNNDDYGVNMDEKYMNTTFNTNNTEKKGGSSQRTLNAPYNPEPPQRSKRPRPDMNGPKDKDIQNLLSGIKTKTIQVEAGNHNVGGSFDARRSQNQHQKEILYQSKKNSELELGNNTTQESYNNHNHNSDEFNEELYTDNGSTISITEIKDLQGGGNVIQPKRTRRKKTDKDKNTMNLDI